MRHTFKERVQEKEIWHSYNLALQNKFLKKTLFPGQGS